MELIDVIGLTLGSLLMILGLIRYFNEVWSRFRSNASFRLTKTFEEQVEFYRQRRPTRVPENGSKLVRHGDRRRGIGDRHRARRDLRPVADVELLFHFDPHCAVDDGG